MNSESPAVSKSKPANNGLKVNNFTDDQDTSNADEDFNKSEVVIDSELEADSEAHLQEGQMSYVESND
jgi:hypothetical protein